MIAVEQEVCFLEKIAPSIDPQNADKPNSNGYDIYVSSNNINIVAELKGMLPCLKNGNFGSQQKDGIDDDLKGLIEGKSKEEMLAFDDNYAWTFSVFGDLKIFYKWLLKKIRGQN